jgi:hypothetical protein
MGGRRGSVPLFALVLLMAACSGETETTSAGVITTLPQATTTTAPWGVAVAPGAEEMISASSVLLREDFQDGEIEDWSIDTGWYLLSTGNRRVLATGGEAWGRHREGTDWSRYAARFGVLIRQGTLGLSVAVGDDGRYVVHLGEDGVYLLKDSPYGSFTTLGSAPPAMPGIPHGVAVGVDGGHLQVYLDGALLIDATDPAPLPGGTIGLGAGDGSSVQVDNIMVAALRGPLPTLQVSGAPAMEAPAPGAIDSGPAGEDGAEPPVGVPDLELVAVSHPDRIDPGDPFDVTFVVANRGDVAVGPFAVAWTSAGDRCEARVDGLAAADSIEAVCQAPAYPARGDYEWLAAADAAGVIDEGGREDNNLAAGTITAGAPAIVAATEPDLVIGWYTLDPESPRPGEPVHIQFGMSQTESAWQGALPLIHFRMFYEDGSTACSDAVFEGESGGTCELPAFTTAGEYWLRMDIDANDMVAESDEADNSTFVTIVVSEVAVFEPPNLYPAGIEFDPVSPRAGTAFTAVPWVVAEPFDAVLGMYTVRLEIDGVVACSRDIDITSGGLICEVAGLAAGTYTWALRVDADDDIAEASEDDNLSWGQLIVRP